jgi:hypothetical protein
LGRSASSATVEALLANFYIFLLFPSLFVKLALWVLKARTNAKVRLAEEELRSGRLYAHERLVEHDGRYNDEWPAQQQRVTKDEPYVQRPYVYSPHRQMSEPYEVPYSSLKTLSIDNDDWEEEKW